MNLIKFYNNKENALKSYYKDNDINYHTSLVINPSEIYLFITDYNTDTNVYLVNCKGEILADITDKCFQNITNVLEIIPLNIYDIGELVMIKIGSQFSNPFYISDDLKNTYRIDYKRHNFYEGTDYLDNPFYQSIRLQTYVSAENHKEDAVIYTQLDGDIRKSRVVQSIETTFTFDVINDFLNKRIGQVFNHGQVYIDGVRFITAKINTNERIQKSNLQKASITGQFNENDTYQYNFQVLEPLKLIKKQPTGVHTNLSYKFLLAEFNRNIIENINAKIQIYNYNTEILIGELTFLEYLLNGFQGLIQNLPNGKYYFNIELGQITDQYNSPFQLIDKSWNFEIKDAEYSNNNYTNEYLI